MHTLLKKMMAILLVVSLLLITGCTVHDDESPEKSIDSSNKKVLRVAVAPSLVDSGLFDQLISLFEQQTNYETIILLADGKQAPELAGTGQVDVVISHESAGIKELIETGGLVGNKYIIENKLVLVGPVNDPAGIEGLQDIVKALGKIALAQAPFISGGHDCGSKNCEMRYWETLGVEPGDKEWYLKTKGGTAHSLHVADREGGYIILDKAVYYNHKNSVKLKAFVYEDPRMTKKFTLSLVNQKHFEGINYQEAKVFADFMVSPVVHNLINNYGADRFGKNLYSSNIINVK